MKSHLSFFLIAILLVALVNAHFKKLGFHQAATAIESAKQNTWVQIKSMHNTKCISYETATSVCLEDCDPLNDDQRWKIVPNGKKFRLVPKSKSNVFLTMETNTNPAAAPTLGSKGNDFSDWVVDLVPWENNQKVYVLYNEKTKLSINIHSRNGAIENVYTWYLEKGWRDVFEIESTGIKNGLMTKLSLESFLINKPVQMHINFAIEETIPKKYPCVKYDSKVSLILADCDDTDVNQKWVFIPQGNTFFISPQADRSLYLTLNGDYPNPPILVKKVGDGGGDFSKWAFIQVDPVQRLYGIQNVKKQLGLETHAVDGVNRINTWPGWEQNHFLFKIMEDISVGVPKNLLNKFLHIQAQSEGKLCYQVDSQTKYIVTERCDGKNKNQRFKIIPKGSLQYAIESEAYPSQFWILGENNGVTIGNAQQANKFWTIRVSYQTMNFQIWMPVDNAYKILYHSGYPRLRQTLGLDWKNDRNRQWVTLREDMFDLKSAQQCRNECSAQGYNNCSYRGWSCCRPYNKIGQEEVIIEGCEAFKY